MPDISSGAMAQILINANANLNNDADCIIALVRSGVPGLLIGVRIDSAIDQARAIQAGWRRAA